MIVAVCNSRDHGFIPSGYGQKVLVFDIKIFISRDYLPIMKFRIILSICHLRFTDHFIRLCRNSPDLLSPQY
jgi:hypothetical protein